MRLLFLTSRFPYPPDRGDRLRTYHFLRRLSAEHDITLVSFAGKQIDAAGHEAARAYCSAIHVVRHSPAAAALVVAANLWRDLPLQALYYRSRSMQQLVDRLLATGHYDAVYVHLFRMAPYVARWQGGYRIVDLTDVISREIAASLPYRNPLGTLIYRLELPRVQRYERRLTCECEEVWLISDAEKAALKPDCRCRLCVVPNGVTLRVAAPAASADDPRRLIFSGHMGVAHNKDAATFLARRIFPRIRAAFPDATLELVGRDGEETLQDVGRLPGVKVAGFVPNLGARLQAASVFVAPLRFAAGIQNKVLEAFAAGVPVVTTPVVARGMGAQHNRHVLIGDTEEALAAAVVQLLEDQDRRRFLAQNARQLLEDSFSWEAVAERLRQIESALALRKR